ncbi:hypothetical protein AJ88_03855 [Mesorhizobium amorphae CCBAU 01583]|nr:hypothetical protein AJ88_03855 [Mesorhizobium amorphae CCBAU 01583]
MADLGLSAILGLVGTGVSAAGTLAVGAARKSAADYQAAQLEQQGKEEKAAAQREAERAKKETNFVLSRQQAVAGASASARSMKRCKTWPATSPRRARSTKA